MPVNYNVDKKADAFEESAPSLYKELQVKFEMGGLDRALFEVFEALGWNSPSIAEFQRRFGVDAASVFVEWKAYDPGSLPDEKWFRRRDKVLKPSRADKVKRLLGLAWAIHHSERARLFRKECHGRDRFEGTEVRGAPTLLSSSQHRFNVAMSFRSEQLGGRELCANDGPTLLIDARYWWSGETLDWSKVNTLNQLQSLKTLDEADPAELLVALFSFVADSPLTSLLSGSSVLELALQAGTLRVEGTFRPLKADLIAMGFRR